MTVTLQQLESRLWDAANALRGPKAYADACNVPYDRLSKVMRGTAIIRFEDVAQAERLLGGMVGNGLVIDGGKDNPTAREDSRG